MGGSSLKNWIDRNYLEGSNITEFHLYDKDSNEQYKSSIEKVNKRPDNSKGVLTLKREMENYIHPSLYEKELEIDCSKIKDWDDSDIANIVSNKTKKFNNEKDVKQFTNGRLTKLMTKEHLIEMNSFDEINNWFIEIKKLNEI